MTIAAYRQHSHCSYCGTAYATDLPWPRQCTHCGHTTFRNPLPVTIVLVPVDAGVLVVRRTIAPHQGSFALPGGYIEADESWQAAGAREVYEEAGLTIDPEGIQLLTVFSASDNTLIIVGQAAPLHAADLSDFVGNDEAGERAILYTPEELAWPLHTQAVQAYFALRSRAAEDASCPECGH
jgi:ADP-ribose pyrophosphatase YjhB (NUDIX family)